MHRPDGELLHAMSRGDEAAARSLHASIGPRLLAYARALSRNDALADDAVQQCWLRALTRPPAELRAINDAAAWMLRIVRTSLLNQARTTTRSTARERLHLSSDTRAPEPLARDHADLHAALDALDDPHREVVLLRHVAQLTFDQIADTLGENRSTIASRHRAALDRLRAALNTPAPHTSTKPLTPRTPEEANHV